jgi:hypothetical protein
MLEINNVRIETVSALRQFRRQFQCALASATARNTKASIAATTKQLTPNSVEPELDCKYEDQAQRA